jgi:hypothetical protein
METEDLRTEQREVSSFHQVTLRDDTCGAELVIQQGETEGLRIQAEPDRLRRIEAQVLNGRLIIRMGGAWLERLGDQLSTSLTRSKVVYHLQVRDLESLDLGCAASVYAPSLRTDVLRITLSGAVVVRVGDLAVRDLRIEHSGTGLIEIAGQATRQEVLLYGTGSYRAQDLRTQESVVRISGSAHARVHASAELQAVVRGMGLVEYTGSPRLQQRIMGMGGVVRVG